MRRRRPGGEGASHERWLVSYADLITLLFALFVVMYAMSRADAVRFKQVAEGLRRAFAEGALPSSATPVPGLSRDEGPGAAPDAKPSGQAQAASAQGGASSPFADTGAAAAALGALRDRLLTAVGAELGSGASSDAVQAEERPEGLLLRLGVQGMYGPGRVQPDPDLLPLVDRLGRELRESGLAVRIEGYTDPDEPGTGWALGAQRASWVADRWIRNLKWEPRKIGVVSFASNHPWAEGGSEKTAPLNRRIEIRILKSDR